VEGSSAERCTACGAAVPASASFCPGCGRPLDPDGGTTVRADLPPDETGAVPVSYAWAEPRWFGVTPALFTLVIAVAAAALAIVLLVTGHWPYGLILLGIGVLALAAFLEVARRKPDTTLAAASAGALVDARERAAAVLEAFAARSRAGRESAWIRSRLGHLNLRRRDLLTALGDAVYRGDEDAAATFRGELEGIDRQAAELEAALDAILIAARERIDSARLAVQQTEMVQIPEPYPPPDEGTPPAPAPVPEPSPPPDEATPPQPDPVPTPGPEPSPGPPSPDPGSRDT
jgi:hypothetical protein